MVGRKSDASIAGLQLMRARGRLRRNPNEVRSFSAAPGSCHGSPDHTAPAFPVGYQRDSPHVQNSELGRIKQRLQRSLSLSTDESLEVEALARVTCRASEDMDEGVRDLIEK